MNVLNGTKPVHKTADIPEEDTDGDTITDHLFWSRIDSIRDELLTISEEETTIIVPKVSQTPVNIEKKGNKARKPSRFQALLDATEDCEDECEYVVTIKKAHNLRANMMLPLVCDMIEDHPHLTDLGTTGAEMKEIFAHLPERLTFSKGYPRAASFSLRHNTYTSINHAGNDVNGLEVRQAHIQDALVPLYGMTEIGAITMPTVRRDFFEAQAKAYKNHASTWLKRQNLTETQYIAARKSVRTAQKSIASKEWRAVTCFNTKQAPSSESEFEGHSDVELLDQPRGDTF